jgi:hypothetical protein
MKLPKFDFEHTIQRVSQMRRLALSLREAYEQQYKLADWLAHFENLRILPRDQFPLQLSKKDIAALHAGVRECWAKGEFAVIVDVANKLPAGVLQHDHMLTAFTGAAREKIKTSS